MLQNKFNISTFSSAKLSHCFQKQKIAKIKAFAVAGTDVAPMDKKSINLSII